MKEKNALEKQIGAVRELENGKQEYVDLIALAEEENDTAVIKEAEDAIRALQQKAEKQELACLLSGEVDGNDAYLEINAGAGGTEAQDWADILSRMYLRWADKRGFKTEILDRHVGDEAGIKSITIEIKGDSAYGWVKTETGVHRLVRVSPFDANAKRHTSFSSVAVSPVIDDDIDINVEEKDLRIDTYRSSGAGGQHVNTTDSAVRITHVPTNVVVSCQAERSQHKNKDAAMKMLKAKLYEIEMRKREDMKMAEHGEKTDIGWGHQIRSYVLHPYQMIKDLRTEVETSNSQGVLDGDIDMFLEASLASRLKGSKDK